MKRLVLVLTLVAMFVLLSGAVLASEYWHIETVDERLCEFPFSLALDSAGHPHITYLIFTERSAGYPYYAHRAGDVWQIERVSDNISGAPSLVLDSAGRPHIAWKEGNVMKYARWDGSKWHVETVGIEDDVVWLISIALDSADRPHIQYLNHPFPRWWERWYYTHWDGDAWQSETVVLELGNDEIGYTRWDGDAWRFETVELKTDNVTIRYSVALDSAGRPHVAYQYLDSSLVYASPSGTVWKDGWVFQTVVSDVEFTDETYWDIHLRLDTNDNPHITFYEHHGYYYGSLRYAHRDGGAWRVETIDEEGNHPSFELDNHDRPHVVYRAEGSLMYAVYRPAAVSRMVVVVDALRLRDAPSTTTGERIGMLYRRDVVEILRIRDNWAEVRTPDGTVGWACVELDGETYLQPAD